jgi:hypothetical protein
MKKIENIDELKSLSVGDKFYVLRNGFVDPFFYCGVHPKEETIILAGACNSRSKIEGITKHTVTRDQWIMIGKYDSKEIGEAMISQLEGHINSIRKIYIESNL